MLVAVSFPHYFLQVPEHLKEQLQTREWVVARITSILERVVDPNVRIVPTVVRFVFCLSPFIRIQRVIPMASETASTGITCCKSRIGRRLRPRSGRSVIHES